MAWTMTNAEKRHDKKATKEYKQKYGVKPKLSKKAIRRAKRKKKEWSKRVFAGWKDTPEQAAFRRSPEYQQWRIKVLERDAYTCQHCEKVGGRLIVHHIKSFKMNEKLRLDVENGIVLCDSCHRELHLSRVSKPKVVKLIS